MTQVQPTPQDLAALERIVASLSPDQKADLDKALEAHLALPWKPESEPQRQALQSRADLLLYGGAAGGGKSDTILGIACTQQSRSVIFRRKFKDLRGLEERLIEIMGDDGYNRSDKVLRRADRIVEFGHLEAPGSEESWQGIAHDFIGFDEGAQLSPYKINFVLGWLRSTREGQRCRAVIGSNPPMASEGGWMLEWFAPWLDPLYPDPAEYGELRWCYSIGSAGEIETVWVDIADAWRDHSKTQEAYYILKPQEGGNVRVGESGERIVDETGRVVVCKGGEHVRVDRGKGTHELYELQSRTFIPSKLDDNPYLRNTKYRAQINAMPEPRRSQLLYGDFSAGREDSDWQVIPSEWVQMAMDRWTKYETAPLARMVAMGVDIAQGGRDSTVIAPLRMNNRFDRPLVFKGVDTKDGPAVGALIVKHRRNGALPVLDLSGGWGGATKTYLSREQGIETVGVVAQERPRYKTRSGTHGFRNARAAMWWAFREALDPESGDNIHLPPDTRLKAQLTAPNYDYAGADIIIEDKEALRARIGSSTDMADAVLLAWYMRRQAHHRAASGTAVQETVAPDDNWLEEY